ncbi:MAG TPA: polymer-forming cytoskeletal protein [Anaeromyxobacteraceae bacterium]|nr:polymer-forming cytoskeletal protein [Anaeromyxobacteraceae bacterium]
MAIPKRDESLASRTDGDLLLGAGAEFEGRLTFAGTVRIDSRFKGTISTDDVLIVGENARVEADVTCGTIVVHGRVSGTIRARDAVELRVPAQVRGDVESPSLSVERGVVFEGNARRPAGPRDASAGPVSAPSR